MKTKLNYSVKTIYRNTGEIEKVWITTSFKEEAIEMFESLSNGMEITKVISVNDMDFETLDMLKLFLSTNV